LRNQRLPRQQHCQPKPSLHAGHVSRPHPSRLWSLTKAPGLTGQHPWRDAIAPPRALDCLGRVILSVEARTLAQLSFGITVRLKPEVAQVCSPGDVLRPRMIASQTKFIFGVGRGWVSYVVAL